MQGSFDFFPPELAPVEKPDFDQCKPVREELTRYIKISGLVGFKDYFMSVKMGKEESMPGGLTKDQFLMMAREVYENRARHVARKSKN